MAEVGALVHGLITGHPFVDGNKRTGLLAAFVCLRSNGYKLASSEDGEPFFWSIARGEQTVESIAAWLEQHSSPSEPSGDNAN